MSSPTAPGRADAASRHDWERPGAFPVAPGVHRVPLPLPNDGLRAVNVYAIQDDARLVLIDAGWALAESRAQLEAALAGIGHDLGTISRFLVTHVHRDHYTQAVTIRRLFGARVALGLEESATLREIQSAPAGMPRLLAARLHAAGAADLVRQLSHRPEVTDADAGEWEDPDEWLRGGTEIALAARTLQVIDTPGHTRGHVVFHDADAGLLFAGDHVLPHITPSIGFESAPSRRPLSEYLASLEVVTALGDPVLLPAHGPVQAGTSARVSQLVEHHRARLEATLRAVGPQPAAARDVAGRLRWTSRETAFADLDLFNQMLAVNETVAHLDVLVERGELRVRDRAGIAWYEA